MIRYPARSTAGGRSDRTPLIFTVTWSPLSAMRDTSRSSWASVAEGRRTSPASAATAPGARNTASVARSSSSASRLERLIAWSASRACSGRRSNTCSATRACMLMAASPWATTSCTSRAMRNCSAYARSRLASSPARRTRRTTAPTVHGTSSQPVHGRIATSPPNEPDTASQNDSANTPTNATAHARSDCRIGNWTATVYIATTSGAVGVAQDQVGRYRDRDDPEHDQRPAPAQRQCARSHQHQCGAGRVQGYSVRLAVPRGGGTDQGRHADGDGQQGVRQHRPRGGPPQATHGDDDRPPMPVVASDDRRTPGTQLTVQAAPIAGGRRVYARAASLDRMTVQNLTREMPACLNQMLNEPGAAAASTTVPSGSSSR